MQYIYWQGLSKEELIHELGRVNDPNANYDIDDKWSLACASLRKLLEGSVTPIVESELLVTRPWWKFWRSKGE